MTDIEPGDLVRGKMSGELYVSNNEPGLGLLELVAKGPGWTRHDGSSVNPVPGAECLVYPLNNLSIPGLPSDEWCWPPVQFYRVTRPAEAPAQSPAPQPGWVATVTLTLVAFEERQWLAKLPDNCGVAIDLAAAATLDWSPPPPPPWEPEIGEPANIGDETVIVRGLANGLAWVEDIDGEMTEERISTLSPPKGGA